MRLDDMIMVSIDDHLVEPPDVFEKHMPAKYLDDAPKVVQLPDGTTRWVFQGNEAGHFALGAVMTWPKEEWTMDPGGYPEMRPGAYDIDARIADMNAGGVLACLCFPTFCGFAGTHLAKGADQDLTAIAFQAYNDWMIDDWSQQYPGRFMPLAIAPVRHMENTAKEIRRVAAKGCRAISLPEVPYAVGLPSFYTGEWDPVFAALCDTDMVACYHIGGAYNALTTAPEAPQFHQAMMSPLLSVLCATDLIAAGVFQRFPTLRVAMSEGGIGWIPFWLDRMDRFVENQAWTQVGDDTGGRTPTQLFRDQFLACFITDPSVLRIRDRIGIDNIAWELDYPHSDSTWPNGPELLLAECQDAGLSDDEIDKISYKNASRFMGFDPFAHTPKDQATVGALRAQALDVDTSETSKHEYRRRWDAAHAHANA
jgi:predicted TIM-barrel fold metal-dependent hydrolase